MSTPTLLILAAGIGSRYGGLKQIDPVGPHGEIILDYSVYDAIRAGFGKLVFVIRRELEADIREHIAARYPADIPVEFAYQEIDRLPPPFKVPPERTKPWGTAHAILVAESVIQEPFCVVNADDFYGQTSYQTMADYLGSGQPDGAYAMVGYVLRNTLSEYGHVARGICRVDANGFLQDVVEHVRIEKDGDAARYQEDDKWLSFSGDEIASLNFWGFDPSLFAHLNERFERFLQARIQEPKAEFFIPTVVDELTHEKKASVKVLPTSESWFGVTYRDDKERVQAGIRDRIAAGIYPENLWNK